MEDRKTCKRRIIEIALKDEGCYELEVPYEDAQVMMGALVQGVRPDETPYLALHWAVDESAPGSTVARITRVAAGDCIPEGTLTDSCLYAGCAPLNDHVQHIFVHFM